jgi:CRP-like cAMP-binding protein
MADEEQALRIAREVILSTFAGEGARGLTWAFRRISAAMQDLFLEQGDVLFTVGEPAIYQYFIVDGEVMLSAEGQRTVPFGPKSAVGMIDAFLERPLSWNAIVTRKAHILRIRIEDWLDVLEDSYELSRIIITNVAAGLHGLRLRPPPLGGFDDPRDLPGGPDPLRPLHLVDRVLLLRSVPVFERASTQSLASLAELATEIRATAGQVIATRGEPKRQMFIVASGRISATRKDPAVVGRFGRGALVCGAMAVAGATEYELRAEVPSHVLEIGREDYFDLMEEHFGLFRSTIRALVEERMELVARG